MTDELNGINEKVQTFWLVKGEAENAEGELTNVCYTEDVKEACAKLIQTTNDLGENKFRYYVKWDGRGHFVNPYHTDFFRLRQRECRWYKASENCFRSYAIFLRTGNKTHLHQAERQI